LLKGRYQKVDDYPLYKELIQFSNKATESKGENGNAEASADKDAGKKAEADVKKEETAKNGDKDAQNEEENKDGQG
jgi:hypothetical protein